MQALIPPPHPKSDTFFTLTRGEGFRSVSRIESATYRFSDHDVDYFAVCIGVMKLNPFLMLLMR